MLHCKQDPRCAGWPANCTLTEPDPDIAGIGVSLSFPFLGHLEEMDCKTFFAFPEVHGSSFRGDSYTKLVAKEIDYEVRRIR
jgi:hypothetical protein